MKRCTEKERDTCRVERLGCEGCYYNTNALLEDLKKQNEWAYRYILDLENRLNEETTSKKYYKERYLEFNNAFVKGGGKLC